MMVPGLATGRAGVIEATEILGAPFILAASDSANAGSSIKAIRSGPTDASKAVRLTASSPFTANTAVPFAVVPTRYFIDSILVSSNKFCLYFFSMSINIDFL